jgi:hypothetical protein
VLLMVSRCESEGVKMRWVNCLDGVQGYLLAAWCIIGYICIEWIWVGGICARAC